jgi:hypothetical protein
MASNILPFASPRFTPEDMASFCQVVVGWAHQGLCAAVLRTRENGIDALRVMGTDTTQPLWSVEKHGPGVYRLVTRARQPLVCGQAMAEVLRCLDVRHRDLSA